jgi:hypothetical protein
MPPSDVNGCQTKWNWSAVPPISVPDPAIVQTPLLSESLPASAGLPISAPVQVGGGGVPQVMLACVWNVPTVVIAASICAIALFCKVKQKWQAGLSLSATFAASDYFIALTLAMKFLGVPRPVM